MDEVSMNILTFDIEEWSLDKCWSSRTERYSEYDRLLRSILELLEEHSIKATFFCLGEIGKCFPEVARLIKTHGHEIGCHSNSHKWINKMTEEEFRFDTRAALDSLEQCVGEKVRSYRAPAFSIGENNKWAFGVLAENGIERDSSVFPVARDFGGFPGFNQKTPCLVEYEGSLIKEFPICPAHLLGRNVAYSGGGYFRFFPLSFIRKEMRRGGYSTCYFHIGDLLRESDRVMTKEEYESYFMEPGTFKNRCLRYVKSNLGKTAAWDKLVNLISSEKFLCLDEADATINWSEVSVVSI